MKCPQPSVTLRFPSSKRIRPPLITTDAAPLNSRPSKMFTSTVWSCSMYKQKISLWWQDDLGLWLLRACSVTRLWVFAETVRISFGFQITISASDPTAMRPVRTHTHWLYCWKCWSHNAVMIQGDVSGAAMSFLPYLYVGTCWRVWQRLYLLQQQIRSHPFFLCTAESQRTS